MLLNLACEHVQLNGSVDGGNIRITATRYVNISVAFPLAGLLNFIVFIHHARNHRIRFDTGVRNIHWP